MQGTVINGNEVKEMKKFDLLKSITDLTNSNDMKLC